jgi:hypothetical protein
MRLAVRPVRMFGPMGMREMRPFAVLDIDLIITSVIPPICRRWHVCRDVVALPCEKVLEATNEPFEAATPFSLMLAFMVLSPLTEVAIEDTLRRKLLCVEFQASKLQRSDSCAKRHEIEICR